MLLNGRAEATFYNPATLSPQFIGHTPHLAEAGKGYLAANRSLITFDALREQTQEWEQVRTPVPFNPTYENNGYDGQLGEQIALTHANNPDRHGPAILLDWAVSVIWSDNLSREKMQAQWHDWNDAAYPNTYIPPHDSNA